MSAQELADLESLYADGVLDEDEYKTKLAELKPAKERTRAVSVHNMYGGLPCEGPELEAQECKVSQDKSSCNIREMSSQI